MSQNGNGLLDASRLFSKRERRYVTVEVEGEKARLRSLTARELQRLRDSLSYPTGEPVPGRHDKIPELLIVHTLVDGEGKPILTEDQISEFSEMDGALFSGLAKAALDHTGWSADYDIDALAEAKKN